MLLMAVITVSVFANEKVLKKGNTYYLSNTVVVKMKSGAIINALEIPTSFNPKLKGVKIFSAHKTFAVTTASLNKGSESLNRIYSLSIDDTVDPFVASQKISKLKDVEWAEPKFIRRVIDSPNDPRYTDGDQINLSSINAEQAWNITKGDSSVIIGIVDTGVDWKHPDLAANIFKVNGSLIPGADLGGLDGTPDNDPSEDSILTILGHGYHGTHVAGIASAVSNNSIGVASIGYNCSILPVKVSRNDLRDNYDSPYIVYGFEGIKYAVDNGAKVINCSWGGYTYSNAEQDVINYAVAHNVLVVAAAGNENSTLLFYPADYDGVLSVGWLETANDKRADYGSGAGANYNILLDVMAPGTQILSTWPTYDPANAAHPNYNSISGSSMSSPLTAGLAALVFTQFPNYTPMQVAERIRATADYDGTYSANPADSVKYLLGRGKIDAFKALSDQNPISVRASKVKFIEEGNGNGNFESGESAHIEITFTNYLSAVSGVNVSLVCDDPAVTITQSSFSIGSLNTLDSTNNSSNEFTFTINAAAALNHVVDFRMEFSGAGYSDFQWIYVKVNPTYDVHNDSNVELTVTSKGALGFNDYPNNLEGAGLRFKNQDNVLFEGALMYGTGSNRLMDVAREFATQSTDFQTLEPVKVKKVGTTDDQVGLSVFNDDGAGNNKLGIKTSMYTYSYATEPDLNYIILRTHFENTTPSAINGLYAGYYFDYDIPGDDYQDDMVGYDDADNFGYAYDLNNLPQKINIGAALISSDLYGFYAINQDLQNGDVTPNNSNGFTDTEKWFALSNGIKSKTAGPADISYVVSGGPFNIAANGSIDVAFALACGETVEDVRAAIRESRLKWMGINTDVKDNENELPHEFSLDQNYPNPFNPSTIIKYSIPSVETLNATSLQQQVSLIVYDLLGRKVATLVNENKSPGTYEVQFDGTRLSSGIYFYRLISGNTVITKKMLMIK